MPEFYVLNYILVGDSNVGKSCLLMKLTQKKFMPDHSPTVGVEFGSLKIKQQDKNFKIIIWDTAGQERYNAIVKTYYKNALGTLLVYDITNRESFLHLEKWIEDIKKYGNENNSIILVGNKTDLKERQVLFEEGQNFAKKHNLEDFIETSALEGSGVENAFLATFKAIDKKMKDGVITIPEKNITRLSSEMEILGPNPNQRCSC